MPTDGFLEFDKLNRQVVKIAAGDKPPKPYIRTIADLEDFMNEALAKQKVSAKKMNATNAKGLNAMKQKIKKNNKDYAIEIDKYREDKFDYLMSSEEEEAAPVEKSKIKKDIYVPDGETGNDPTFSMVLPGGRTLQYTPESILTHLRTITESRGKKNTDRVEQIRIMERLNAIAVTPYQKVRVLLTLISTRFDLTTGSSTNFMPQEQWKLYVRPLLIDFKLETNRVTGPTKNLAHFWKFSRIIPIW
jgi:translation initiation factor 3 subunit C